MLHYQPLNLYFELFLNVSDINSLYSLSKEYNYHFKSLISKLYKDININISVLKNEPFYVKCNIYGKAIYWYNNFINKHNFIFDTKTNSYYNYFNIGKENYLIKQLPFNKIIYSFSNSI